MPRGSKNGFGISHLVISAAALLLAVVLGYAIYMVVISNRAALITATVEYASVDDGPQCASIDGFAGITAEALNAFIRQRLGS